MALFLLQPFKFLRGVFVLLEGFMLDPFERKVSGYIETEKLFENGKVFLAVSGGADSVALAAAVSKLRAKGTVSCNLFMGHINHNLRGKLSAGDQDFVEEFANKLGIECVSVSVDVEGYAQSKKLSIETAARQLRIENLIEIAGSLDCDKIATAHHSDDNAETVLHRLSRGTGFRGLCGILPNNSFCRDDRSVEFVRPMLDVTKKEILDYCRGKNIKWRHDHTNDQFAYTRNKIRHLLIPEIEKSGNEVCKSLNKLAKNCRKLYKRIDKKIEIVKDKLFTETDERVSVNGDLFSARSPLVQAEIIRRAMVRVGCGQRHVSRKHYAQIISMPGGEGGKIIELPGGFTVRLELGNLVFYRPCDAKTIEAVASEVSHRVKIQIGGKVKFGDAEIKALVLNAAECDFQKFIAEKDSNIEWFDMDKIAGDLYARKRKTGDRFVPLGLTGEKKIGRFLTANKIDYRLREKVIIIEDDKRIIWVSPVRASEKTRVDRGTKNILQIQTLMDD